MNFEASRKFHGLNTSLDLLGTLNKLNQLTKFSYSSLTSGLDIENNIESIVVPGIGSLDLSNFDNVQDIKGINFIDIPAKVQLMSQVKM